MDKCTIQRKLKCGGCGRYRHCKIHWGSDCVRLGGKKIPREKGYNYVTKDRRPNPAPGKMVALGGYEKR